MLNRLQDSGGDSQSGRGKEECGGGELHLVYIWRGYVWRKRVPVIRGQVEGIESICDRRDRRFLYIGRRRVDILTDLKSSGSDIGRGYLKSTFYDIKKGWR